MADRDDPLSALPLHLSNLSQAASFCDSLAEWNASSVSIASSSSYFGVIGTNTSDASGRPPGLHVWGFGMLFVTLISLCAAVGILIMPLLSKQSYGRLLTYLVGLGVGSLSGSAVFHLLPQAFGLVDASSIAHEYLQKSWMAVGGIYLFFFVDKLLKIVIEFKKRRKEGRSNNKGSLGRQHESSLPLTNTGIALNGNAACKNEMDVCDQVQVTIPNGKHRMDSTFMARNSGISVDRQAHGICAHDHDVQFNKGDSVIATVAWMIIFGDGLHNFIDGLTIGASFSESILGGIGVSVAVLCEEFPHELGDVAILVSAGMTLKQALVYNLLSACSCYLGFIIGVMAGNMDDRFASCVFALAGGMFLYIALASMVPEMNHAMEEEMGVSISKGLMVLLLQSLGVFTGLFTMYLMASYGSLISFE